MYKDEVLNELADIANVAQFVSFGPDGSQRFSRVLSTAANYVFPTMKQAVDTLLDMSLDYSVNVRSFRPEQPQGNEFHYGVTSVEQAMSIVDRLTNEGMYVIVHETIDVNDGGVSGVMQGGCMEFAPGVTPRFVEKDNSHPIPLIPKQLGIKMLETVYKEELDLDFPDAYRVEFSIHPNTCGWMDSNTIVWELELLDTMAIEPYYVWPNAFSTYIGDKVYGLLLANLMKLPVPRTTCFPRNKEQLSTFMFGRSTGTGALWTRTCPKVQEPGKFTTVNEFTDPWRLMQTDDPKGENLASCIVQDGVASTHSGAAFTDADGNFVIEGVEGFGDQFMQGKSSACTLPESVVTSVHALYYKARTLLGDVRFEWAYDGNKVWILQLHVGRAVSSGRTIVPGDPAEWVVFDVRDGLESLRSLVANKSADSFGVYVQGHVGMSSHVADILRKAAVPSKMVSTNV